MGNNQLGTLIIIAVVILGVWYFFLRKPSSIETEEGTLQQQAGIQVKLYDINKELIQTVPLQSIISFRGDTYTGVYYLGFPFTVTNIGDVGLTAHLVDADPNDLWIVTPRNEIYLNSGEQYTWETIDPIYLVPLEKWSQPVTFKVYAEGYYQYGGVTDIRRVYDDDSVLITIQSDALGEISVTISPGVIDVGGGICVWDDNTCIGTKKYQCNEQGEWIFMGDCAPTYSCCCVGTLSTPAPGGGTHYQVCTGVSDPGYNFCNCI